MNIAFDAVGILSPTSKNRGIGNYCLDQFREMIAQDKENNYFFFNVMGEFSLGDFPNLKEEYFDCGRELGLLRVADNAVYKALLRAFLEKNKIDVFYITSPFDAYMPVYQKDWFEGVRTVATVYDIIPYVFKDHYFQNNESGFAQYMSCVNALRWVDELLVISQSVKDDLENYLDFPGDNIVVIWGASSNSFRKIEVSAEDADALRKKYRIGGDFIMCTGGDDERKNIAGLIEAYAGLPASLKESYSLVIVCKLHSASVQRYSNLAKELGVQGKVILTNFVTSQELLQLYNLASLVAFPSKYEGFGLPVVEAWACHTPVLTSNNSSLVQIAGDAAITVNADSVADITRGLEEALQEQTLKDLTKKGLARLEMFRWSAVAAKAVAAINTMDLPEAAPAKAGKPKVAWFTPLPPQQSGIADYSMDILNAMAQIHDIDVFIDGGYTPTCPLNESIHVYPHDDFPKKQPEYDHVLFQMGNSMFHYYMYPYLHKYGGTLVLHDYNMHGVGQYVALHVCKDDMQTYEKYLLEDYPQAFVDTFLKNVRDGKPLDASLELNGFVSNYADKIIVHSAYAQRKLLEKDISKTVFQIPHYAHIEPLCDQVAAREALGIPADSFVFAAFGHIHETKRAIPVLKTAIRLMKADPKIYLLFVGKLADSIKDEFTRIWKSSGVSDRIVVTDYIELDQFCTYIDASDVCLNLRYPYNGENSGSLARILARQRCVVVNDVGSFGEIPDECCVKLPPVETMSAKQEESLLYQTMKTLLGDKARRETISANARKYAEEVLDLHTIAGQYAQAIAHTGRSYLTEKILYDVKMQEIFGRQYTPDEIRRVAKTLTYCAE